MILNISPTNPSSSAAQTLCSGRHCKMQTPALPPVNINFVQSEDQLFYIATPVNIDLS